MIAMKYINKTAATVAAVRDYENMRFSINHTPQEIKDIYEHMTSPRGPKLSGMPLVNNPQAGDDMLAAHIDKLDFLRERYSQAFEYLAWFEPEWSSLTKMEQHNLSEFYITDNQKSGATYRLMNELSYSESQIERLRSNSINHLRSLLYGS